MVCEESVSELLQRLKKAAFPIDDMYILSKLAHLCGTEDIGLLCMVCYLYGLQRRALGPTAAQPT